MLNCHTALIPVKATDLFSVLDVSMNKPYKSYMRDLFGEYCTEAIVKQLQKGVPADEITLDVRISTIKPFCGKWLVAAWQQLSANSARFIQNGWDTINSTIDECLSTDNTLED